MRLHPKEIFHLPVDYIQGVQFKELLKIGGQLGLYADGGTSTVGFYDANLSYSAVIISRRSAAR